MTNSTNDIIANLTSNIVENGSIPVAIPSNGLLYGKDFQGVTLRAMTLADEKAGQAAVRNGENPVNTLLGRCLGGIQVDSLLSMDRDYLLIKLRELSFGQEFKATCPCPKCSFDNRVSFVLSKLPVEPLPEGFSEPIEINLLQSKLTVKLNFPRVRDEAFLLGDDPLDCLWRFISSIKKEGEEEEYRDKEIICAVVDKLQIADLHAIVRGLSLEGYGLQTKVKIGCTSCKATSVIDLPLDQNFFTVTS